MLQYALRLANAHTRFVFIHIVETATAKLNGANVQDMETLQDRQRLDEYVALFATKGLHASGILGYRTRAKAIATITKEQNADLLIMGSHGHKTLKDWIFGETINSVRHILDIPIFIAQ